MTTIDLEKFYAYNLARLTLNDKETIKIKEGN